MIERAGAGAGMAQAQVWRRRRYGAGMAQARVWRGRRYGALGHKANSRARHLVFRHRSKIPKLSKESNET